MNKLRICFELDGLHAWWLRAALECANRATGRPMTESELARGLLCSILEEDAHTHEEMTAQ